MTILRAKLVNGRTIGDSGVSSGSMIAFLLVGLGL
jgi:hypothetical protein